MPTILTPPTAFATPSSFKLTPAANTQSGGVSPLDGTEQTLEQPGARWAATLTFEGMPEAEARAIFAFLAFVGGRAGRFTWSPPLPRRGTATSAGGLGPRVRTAGQTGNILRTTGWAGSGFVFEAGDLFGATDTTGRARMLMVRETVGRAGADADFNIWPSLWPGKTFAADAALVLTNPSPVWKLTGDRTPMDLGRGLIGAVTVQIEEALV